jgi:serine protease AprX
MNKVFVILFLFVWSVGFSQNRYMVFFKDKQGSVYSTSNPSAYLSQRAIDRSAKENIAISEEDLPVNESYLEVIRNLGATVLYPTKWMNGVLVECEPELATTLQSEEFVERIEYVAPGVRPAAGRVRGGKFKESNSDGAAATDVQLSMLGLDQMHANGYRGEGVLIAVMDAGFPGGNGSFFQHIVNENRLELSTSYDFVSGNTNVFTKHYHGTHVWSIMGAYSQGLYTGGAYKARYVLFITEYAPTEYRVEEYNWLFAAERADSLGVDIINTSLGYTTFDDPSMDYTQSQIDGETAVITRAASMAASKGILVVVSAGNSGNDPWQIISAPADSKDVLAIGAVTSSGTRSSFSSMGPTADGRIKPDVAALGSGVSFITPSSTIGTGNGTSYAAPLIASLAATLKQKFPNLLSADLRDTIRKISSQAEQPDNLLGYGIPNVLGLITSIDSEVGKIRADIYPNPFTSQVILQLYDVSSREVKVRGSDSKGMGISMEVNPVYDDRLIVDLKSNPPGLYFIHLSTGTKTSVYRVVKVE